MFCRSLDEGLAVKSMARRDERFPSASDWCSIRFLALLLILLRAFPAAFSADVASAYRVVYVRLADSKSRLSRPCGDSLDTACGSLSLAVEGGASNVWISLQPSLQDVPRLHEEIEFVHDLVIDGSDMDVPFDLEAVVGPGKSNWLTLRNCTNVLVQHLNVLLKDYKGQNETAIFAQNCYNVTLQCSVFKNITLGGHAFRAENTWPIVLMNNTFIGREKYHQAPNTTFLYSLAAVRISINCSPLTCAGVNLTDSNLHPSTIACCAGIQASAVPMEKETESPFYVTIESCEFLHLGIEPIYEIYFRFISYQRASALHVETFSGHVDGFRLLVRNCLFADNSSPYDTTLKLYFGKNTRNNHVTIEDCEFRSCWSYRGGAITYIIDKNTYNTRLSVKRCNFTGNEAYLEGGAIAINLPRSINVSEVFIEDSVFHSNVGGSLFPTLVGGAISSQTLSHNVEVQLSLSGHNRLPLLNITRSMFINNSASYGSAFFVSGMYLTLRNV